VKVCVTKEAQSDIPIFARLNSVYGDHAYYFN